MKKKLKYSLSVYVHGYGNSCTRKHSLAQVLECLTRVESARFCRDLVSADRCALDATRPAAASR